MIQYVCESGYTEKHWHGMVRPVKLMLSRKVSKKCSDLHMESITSRNFEKVLTLNFDNLISSKGSHRLNYGGSS